MMPLCLLPCLVPAALSIVWGAPGREGRELPLSVVNWQVVGEVWWGVMDQKERMDQGKERGEW